MTVPGRHTVTVDHAPRPADLAFVRASLMAFNEAAVGSTVVAPLALYVRDAEGAICAGLTGYTAWQWLYIDLLWVDEPLRGQGYGSELLGRVEQVAREAGCVAARLETYEFQARPFYERHGYAVYAVLEGYPAGTRTHYMQKAL